eukprot:SAG22_NODE_446_length_10427_cov_14.973373_5_plen_116_part_00
MRGTITDFEFHGKSDWGIRISKLDDENYQLMLAGERFNDNRANSSGGSKAAPDTRKEGETELEHEPVREKPAASGGCWEADVHADHSCTADRDCGVDELCRTRTCSRYGMCHGNS